MYKRISFSVIETSPGLNQFVTEITLTVQFLPYDIILRSKNINDTALFCFKLIERKQLKDSFQVNFVEMK